MGLLRLFQSPLPYTGLCHGEDVHGLYLRCPSGGKSVGKFERAGIDGSPTEQRCLETWSEKQGLLHILVNQL